MRQKKEYGDQSREANAELLERFREINIKTSSGDVLMVFATLLGRVGRHLLNKKHTDFEEHESLGQIFDRFDEELSDLETGQRTVKTGPSSAAGDGGPSLPENATY